MIARWAMLLVVTATTVAHADAPVIADPSPHSGHPGDPADPADPAVQDASDANLEITGPRRGLTFALSLGGGLIVGVGIEDSVGRGGSVSLRLGHAATRRTVLTFEITGTAALHKPAMMSAASTNTNANLLAGAQYYVNRSLWLRAAGGVGVYTGRDVALPSGQRGTVTLAGPAVLGGIGVEILRFRSAVVGFEFGTSAMVNRDGVLIASGGGLDLSFD